MKDSIVITFEFRVYYRLDSSGTLKQELLDVVPVELENSGEGCRVWKVRKEACQSVDGISVIRSNSFHPCEEGFIL